MSSPWFVTLLCWMLVALPVETKAQEAARSLAELMGAKGTFVGEDVYITRATGRPISGAIADLSPDALSVTSRLAARSFVAVTRPASSASPPRGRTGS